jgi:YVTN family beta-propeller protein
MQLSIAFLAALSALHSAPQAAAGGTLLVLNKSDATLSLLDPASGAVLRTGPTGEGPHEVAVSPDGEVAVVCDYGAATPGSTLTVYELDPFQKRGTIDLGAHRRPHGIAFEDPDHVIVTTEESRSILRVDVTAGKVATAIETGQAAAHMVALDAAGRRAYVANIGSGSVTAVDLAQGAVVKHVPTGAGAEGIDVTPDGKQVWVGNRAANTLSVIDAAELKVVAELACGNFPIRVRITPDGRYALVSNAQSGDVAVFSVAEREEVTRIALKQAPVEGAGERLFGEQFGQSPVPVGILIEPAGKRAFVASTNADTVTVIDLARWQVAERWKTGREPDGMAWSPLAASAAARLEEN